MLGLKNVREMLDAIARNLRNQSSAFEAQILERINSRYMEIASVGAWRELDVVHEYGTRRNDDTVDGDVLPILVDGEAEAPLPWLTGRLKSLHLQSPGRGRALIAKDAQTFYDETNWRSAQSGPPLMYTYLGVTAQERRLNTLENIEVFCNNANNDGQRVVRVHLKRQTTAFGFPKWQDIEGSFSTGSPITGTPAKGWPIERVSLPPDWSGSVFVRGVTSGTNFVTIGSIEQPDTNTNDNRITFERPLIRVWPVPNADYKCTVVYTREPYELTEDEDAPLIPVSEYLIDAVTADLMEDIGRVQEAQPRRAAAIGFYQAVSGRHTNDAARKARPYRGNFLRQTGTHTGWPY